MTGVIGSTGFVLFPPPPLLGFVLFLSSGFTGDGVGVGVGIGVGGVGVGGVGLGAGGVTGLLCVLAY